MLTAAKLVLPALAAALFVWGAAWCVVRTLRPQMADTAAVGGEPPRSSKAMAALAGLLFVCVLQLVFCHAAQANNPGVGLAQAMEWQFYGNTDARHYIDLAQYGYGTGGAFAEQELMIVFFPLFPALLRVVHLLVGGSYPLLGLAVQGPLFAGAAVSLYTLVSRRWGERQAVLTLALLMASPAAVFFAVPMTESLFLLVTVRYVLAWDRRQWGRCAVLGVLAGLCRAPGGLLLGLAALELAAAWRRGKRPALASILAMLAPAAGLVLGAVGLLRLEEAAGRLMHTGSKEHGRMGRVVLAVTLHNLPEGMVVGLAAALALQGEPEAVSGALALALGIGLQNIPEGAAVSLPLAQAGQGRRKAFK